MKVLRYIGMVFIGGGILVMAILFHFESESIAVIPIEQRRSSPNFTATDTNGVRFQLSDYKGKTVLLTFWATWCTPCEAERPQLMAIQSTYHGKSVEVVGIAMDRDGAATVREFLARHRTNYRIAYGDEALAEKFGGAQILPITLFIDRDGLIAARALGYRASAPLLHKHPFTIVVDNLLREPR